MGFDSYIAWVVYCGSDVVTTLKGLQSDISMIEMWMNECGQVDYENSLIIVFDILKNTKLPKHPTAMTPDELLDFAMRFVQNK